MRIFRNGGLLRSRLSNEQQRKTRAKDWHSRSIADHVSLDGFFFAVLRSRLSIKRPISKFGLRTKVYIPSCAYKTLANMPEVSQSMGVAPDTSLPGSNSTDLCMKSMRKVLGCNHEFNRLIRLFW